MLGRKKISIIICLLSLAVLGFSGYKILKYHFDALKTNQKIEDLIAVGDVTDFDEKQGSDDELSAEQTSAFLDVDLTALKAENADVKGWLKVSGTNVNYPFLQANNNRYYLERSFDRSYNSAGWVFLDYRNDANLRDKNNIIYAHGRLDRTMFGSLRELRTDALENPEKEFIIKTRTETEMANWRIFSVYIVPTTSDYLETTFRTETEFKNFINMLTGRSEVDFKVEANENDQILTLSTCYGTDTKLVVHGVKIKSLSLEQ